MSSCCTVGDENKEEMMVDHSLKAVVAFSSTKREMCIPHREEGLLVKGDDDEWVDRRTLVDFCDEKFGLLKSYRMLCQLTSRLPKGSKMVGTCFRMHRNKSEYILTCAHNLIAWSPFQDQFSWFKWCIYYEMRQGVSSWANSRYLDLTTARVHPKHDGWGASGFDIAVCHPGEIVTKGRNNFVKHRGNADVMLCACDPQNLSKGMSVELAGYPGEKDGQPHTHTGKIVDCKKTKLGGHVIFYDVDATCGNSGSPLMITDEKFLKKHNAHAGVQKMVIGIHNGNDAFGGYNYGTLITPSLEKWIYGEDYPVEKKEEDVSEIFLVDDVNHFKRQQSRSYSTPTPMPNSQ